MTLSDVTFMAGRFNKEIKRTLPRLTFLHEFSGFQTKKIFASICNLVQIRKNKIHF